MNTVAQILIYMFLSWDALHVRLSSHTRKLSNRAQGKSCLLILDLNTLRS